MDDLQALTAAFDQPVEQLTYEQAFKQLERIVAVLESSEYSLEDSLRLFERGQTLAQVCAEMLDTAELKVKQLSGDVLTDLVPLE